MASDYHQTGRGTGYTINSDGTVTRYVSTAKNRSSNRRPKRVGWWVFLFIVFVVAAVGIGVYAYYENSYLIVSPSNITIGAEGGTIDIRVDSNRDWYISTGTASWGRTSKYGRYIEWEVSPNIQTSERTDYIDLSCTNCTQRIHIKQDAKKYLNISPVEIEVPEDGGSYSFTVSSNESWHISVNTLSWGHLKKNGDRLHLTIDENTELRSREDYFIIKSASGIEQRVNISQKKFEPSATINQVWVDHNVYESGIKGMRIHIDLDVNGMQNKNGQAIAYFYYKNGDPIVDKNSRYCTVDGKVAAYKNFSPISQKYHYSDFVIFMPHNELHLSQSTSFYFKIYVWNGDEYLTDGGRMDFEFTIN